MFRKILVVLALIILGFFLVVALQPADFRIERSAVVNAPIGAVFAQVNDFHNWPNWSPWAKIDPNLEQGYAGAPAGMGAVYTWSGNDQVGAGRMTILESRPNERIRINLEFLKPYETTNLTEFTFAPEGERTRVTWSMSGRNNFMGKAFALIMNMDKLVGRDFDKGLAQLEAAAQSEPVRAGPDLL